MEYFNITGMSCAACSSRIEKAVSALNGVEMCSVNLLTNSMAVDGWAEASDIIKAVEQAGYGAAVKGAAKSEDKGLDGLEDTETPKLKKRLIGSLVFLLVLMYISMGHTMWGFPLPPFFEGNCIGIGLLQLLLTVIIMVINQKFFISGFKGLINRAPNMDTLVALGAGASFVYSVYVLFAMTAVIGNTEQLMAYMHEFYFESAAMILTLITVGKMLEARSKGKTTDALKGLMSLSPKTAVVLINDKQVTVPAEQVKKGDKFVVRPGESIPVDGIIIEGKTAVNESALTGESIPVDKAEGDGVYTATINQYGFITCEATRVGEDTTLSQIIKMVSDAAATKAPVAKAADKVSGVFVPFVICCAVVTAIFWLLAGEGVGFALARAISVLVISCPCALGLATPVAIMVGSGMGAKNGILFKNAVSLEETGKTQIAVLDKTGTITAGSPQITNIIPMEGIEEERLLKLAYSLEVKSEHPLANAIKTEAEQRGMAPFETSDFKALSGNGLKAVLDGHNIFGGSLSFIKSLVNIPDNMEKSSEKLAREGKTPLFFGMDNKLLGIIAVADVIKSESPQAVKELQKMGICVVMLTGDNEQTANAIGKQAGVDGVIAGVLPDGKERVIRQLKKIGRVAMVGDGINDAPALTSADTGMAIGAGADVAIDAANVVLMRSSLLDVPAAIRLSRGTLRNIYENLFWAFIYNVIGIPLAAGVFIPLLSWQLNPMFGAAAMSLSSFCVVTNALRLNLKNIHSSARDKKLKKSVRTEDISSIIGEKGKKEILLKIEGMMCPHCEARVKKYLEMLPQVDNVTASHKEGIARITLNGDIDMDILKKTVEEQGYKVIL